MLLNVIKYVVCELVTDHIHALTVPVQDDLAAEVKEITKRFDEITKDWYVLRWREGDGRIITVTRGSCTHVRGRETDKEYNCF